MIPNNAYDYCCEDISLIENYEAALADTSETEWVCHHRFGIELNKTHKELEEMGLYYNRPACELCFMTLAEHTSLHHKGNLSPLKGKKLSAETRAKMSASHKGKPSPMKGKTPWNKGKKCGPSPNKGKPLTKYKWLTPDGEIKIMAAPNAIHWHPDWVRIEKVD